MPIRHLALFAAFTTLLLSGCGKATPTSSGGEGAGSDPNATYTLKIREKQAGEKYQVAQEAAEDRLNGEGKGSDKEMAWSVNRVKTKLAYTEEVLEMADGSGGPARARRTYTTAEVTEADKTHPLSFAGKTVLIERQPDKHYTVKIDGAGDLGADAEMLQREFAEGPRPSLQSLLPTKAVKANETWEVPADKVEAFLRGNGGDPKGAAKASGKLTRAEMKDGKPYGELTVRIEMPPGNGPSGSLELTYEGFLDGSATDSKRALAMTIKFPSPTGKGNQDISMNNSVSTTIKTVK